MSTDVSDGYSISFWIRVDDSKPSLSGSVPYLLTDREDHIFFARKKNGGILFGMSLIRDRLVVKRYIQNKSPVSEFDVWLYNPVNLSNHPAYKDKWHFVSLVYTKNSMQVYVGKPDGSFECRSNYFGMQDLSEAHHWGIGGLAGNPIQCIDDFKTYSIPLSRIQVKNLFETERPFNMYNTYNIISVNSGKKMVVNTGSRNIEQRDLEDTTSEWHIQNTAEHGVYKLLSQYNDLYADIENSSYNGGANVVQNFFTNNNSQKWHIQYDGTDSNGNYYKIINRNSGQALDVYGRSTKDRANIIQWGYAYRDNQRWYIKNAYTPLMIDEGEYYIFSKQNLSLGLDVKYSTKENLVRATNIGVQPWKIDYHGDGRYKIALAHNNNAVIGDDTNSNKIIVNYFINNNAQYWRFIKMGDNNWPYYRIVNYKNAYSLLLNEKHHSAYNPVRGSVFYKNEDKQNWYLIPKSNLPLNGKYRIKNSAFETYYFGKYIDNIVSVYRALSKQSWDIKRLPDGYYTIKQKGKWLIEGEYERPDRADDHYVDVLLSDYYVADNNRYKWFFRKIDKNKYMIVNASGNVMRLRDNDRPGAVSAGTVYSGDHNIWELEHYNDTCKDAITITCGQSVSGTTDGLSQDNVGMCGDNIIQDPQGKTPSVWYRLSGLRPNTTVTVSTCSSVITQLVLYKASSTCSLMECIPTRSSTSNCGNNKLSTTITFTTDNNMEKDYFVMVSGYLGGQGKFKLSVNCHGNNLDLYSKSDILPKSTIKDKNSILTEDKQNTANINSKLIDVGDIYPNTSGQNFAKINININEADQLKMIFFDINGIQIKSKKYQLSAGLNNLTLKLSDLKNGFYIVHLMIKDKKFIRKLIK